jgi:hypothetical protein
VIPKLNPELAKIMNEWIDEADRVCGFGFPQDWIEKKIHPRSKSDPNEFYYYQAANNRNDYRGK